MSKYQAFMWGALGGLMPVLLSAVTVDLAPVVDSLSSLSIGTYVGYVIRVIGVLVLGGVIALLNIKVQDPLALVQLGIAAPALVTAYISAKPPAVDQPKKQVR